MSFIPNSQTGTRIVVTEEHFAACLIECGPHEPKVRGMVEYSPAIPSDHHSVRAYYDAIYNWYCINFLYMGDGCWQQYLRDYCNWVEK